MVRLRNILLTLLLLLPLCAPAQNTQKQESRKAALQREIEEINRQLKANAKSSSRALSDLQLVQKKIANRKELIAESDRDIRALGDSIRLFQKEIDRQQARLDTLSLYYNRLVRGAYKNRDNRLWYMYILASENLGQGFRRFSYLKGLSREMSRQAIQVRTLSEELSGKRDSLAKMKREAEGIRLARVKDVQSLQVEEGESQTLINRLNKDRKKYQADLERKNREIEALNREIAEIIRKATAGKGGKTSGKATSGKSGKTTSTEVDTKLSGQFAANKGRLPWPVAGTVIETFGQHYHPVFKNIKLPFNNGVTLSTGAGAPVKAVFDGVVTQIVMMPGYNKCVLVRHGEYFTFYCKMRDVTVKAGDKVKTGDRLGSVDTIGGENQFHFQLWSGRQPQDPETWLKK
jgi:septal ring factor EnvC (AmiA/AmiB activator)